MDKLDIAMKNLKADLCSYCGIFWDCEIVHSKYPMKTCSEFIKCRKVL
jgi:hypothetical protein